MTDGCRYAFIVSRFPQLTETFILREFVGLEARGLDFELFAVIHQGSDHLQPDAVDLDARAHYMDWRSADPWTAQLHWLRRAPRRWAQGWLTAISASRRSWQALIRVPHLVLTAGSMARRMQRLGIERIHVQWLTIPTTVAMVIQTLTDLPISVTAHAHDIWGETGNLEARVRAADEIITCTDRGRRVIMERLGAWAGEKVTVIHHGVDLAQYAMEPRRVRAQGDPLRILCVAALLDHKGHIFLIEGCRLLVDRGIDLELTLIGEGPERERLEGLVAESGLGERVRFLGRQTLVEVRAQLSRCDVFALASVSTNSKGWMDGIPNVLVEALAVGRPAVASDISGIPELIVDGESGLLAREQDPTSIADALERIARDPELVDRLVAGGRRAVEAEHDAGHNIDLVLAELQANCTDLGSAG